MRRAPVLLAAVSAAAAAAAVALSAGFGTQATPARLRLVEADPVTLRATGFKPNERVRITVVNDGRVRRAVAGSGGGFTMRLPGVHVNACAGFSVTATGDRGSRASYKRVPGVCAVP